MAVFTAVVVVIQLGLSKQPVAVYRLAVADKRAVAVKIGFFVFNITAGIHAVVQPLAGSKIVLAVEAVAPRPFFFVAVIFILCMQMISDKRFVGGALRISKLVRA